MSRSIAGKQAKLATQAWEVAFTAPQVIAERTARMMFNPATKADWERMGSEKVATGIEMWNAMAAASWKAWLGFCFPWTVGQGQHAVLDVMSKGMGPVDRRTVANARGSKRAKRR